MYPHSIVIGIATRGRPATLARTLLELGRQTRPADSVVVSYVEESDLLDAPQRFPFVTFIASKSGLTSQRNTILRSLSNCSLIMFLDDDFHMHSEYLRFTEEHFSRHPCTMATTGSLLMDGINGPGLTADEAVTALSIAQLTSVPSAHRVFNAYGCNMCFRFDIIRSRELYFDESLPLYGWYEDVDFCRRMAPYGAIVRLSHAIGVHLGVKGGRQSGRRLGYSQVANPIYLMCKRSVPWYFAITSLATRFMKNLVLTCAPEPHIDRLGRLKGNLIALRDLSGGKLHPLRATDV